METSLDKKIEAVLFYKGEPVKITNLSTILDISVEETRKGIVDLKERLSNSGLSVIEKDGSVLLVTNDELSETIEKLRKNDLNKSLSKAALETLTIIVYRGPVKRSEVDYIRGVSSQFILRTLLIRGLIEKKADPKDDRSFLYRPTFETIQFLGISRKEDMPEYEQIQKDIDDFINNQDAGE
ncbi:MAG: segregation and condensation protein B [Candidatus Paceibacteria bacterium]|jgi:segregation and condensation protein B